METLRPDITEEIESLRRSLERTDTIVGLRNQEISALKSRLAAKDETIAEAGEQLDRLESELAAFRSQTQLEKSTPTGTNFEVLDAADLLNQLKGRRKKSKADLADVEAILEILGGDDNG